jgi:hypothetical protein
MQHARLDTRRRVECTCFVPLVAGELRMLIPSMAVGAIIDRSCIADGVDNTC